MNRRAIRLLTPTVAALILSACATQAPAPVVNGTTNTSNSGVYTPSTNTSSTSTNPYGAEPYNPNNPVNTGNTGSSTPTADSSTQTATTPNTSYTGNYAPVDVNATYHRVVAGDTVYNISKRYGISQDQLRQWNGLSDNNISIGQNLRVKADGAATSSNTNTTTTAATTAQATGAHTVVAGDTVYNIANRYGMSQDQLRALNNIQGNEIKIGQVLRVHGNTASAATTAPATTSTPASTTPIVASSQTVQYSNITWQSPLPNGKLTSNYTTASRSVKLSGSKGQAVVAAADGQVVFSGAGPRGYGNLVVVQHTPKYLTAYGNNQTIAVKEMQQVKRGQTLAYLGNEPLMFEIRQDGKPFDPSSFLKF